MTTNPDSVAGLVARVLKRRGVERVFALCGGHIMPIWMRLDAEGIRIVDVRDERAAVHMAQAHAELTGGLGVALVTAGPGVTNAMTGIANAHVSRAPVLVLSGTSPRPQENRGGLQDLDHTHLVRAITRYARTVREPDLALAELDEAIARALGEGGEPGPAYIDFPTDTLRGLVPPAVQLEEHLRAKPRPVARPDHHHDRPESWDDVGGPGSISGFETNLSLVVSQTQEVHEQIADLLEQLRRLQDLQVTIEVRFITLSDNFFERIGVDFDFHIDDNTHLNNHRPAAGRVADRRGQLALRRRQQQLRPSVWTATGPTADLDFAFDQGSFGSAHAAVRRLRRRIRAANFGFAILSDIEVFFLLQAAQGDDRTNILQAPKVTLFNGQTAFVSDTSQRPFVTQRHPGRRRLRRRPAAGDRRAQRRHVA